MSSDTMGNSRTVKSRGRVTRASYRGQAKINSSSDVVNKGYESSQSMTMSGSSDHTLSLRNQSLSEGSGRSSGPSASTSGSSDFRVNIDKFKEMIRTISPYKYSKITELPANIGDMFSAIKVLISGAAGSNNKIELLASINDEIMKDVKIEDIQPDTLVSKLIGCSIAPCDGITTGCSQLCAGSLHPPSELTGVVKCPDPVFLFNGLTFITLTYGSDSNSGKAYVYVSKDFKGFGQSDIDALNRVGIKQIKLIVLDTDPSKCISVAPDFVSLNLFMQTSSMTNSDAAQPMNKQSSNISIQADQSSSMSSWWWWILLIILLLILIGVGIYFARRQNAVASAVLAEKEENASMTMHDMYAKHDVYAKQTPTLAEFDYIGGMRPYSRY